MRNSLPKPEFSVLTEFAKTIHEELNGQERKKTINQLDQWQVQKRREPFSPDDREKREALDEAFDLAKKITKRAFFAPWECEP